MPTDSEQIRALLSDTAFDLVTTTLGKARLEPGDYAKVITVSFDTVVEYLLANCSVSDVAEQTESQRDGYYALPGDKCWVVYSKERACTFHRDVVHSKREVFIHFTQHNLGIHQSGNS